MTRTHGPESDHDPSCFGCKILGVGFAYPWGGREVFHGPTLRERGERAVTEARAAGLDPQPIGTRWV